MAEYDSYGDWFDNGPGSESWKRKKAKEEAKYIKSPEYQRFFWKFLRWKFPDTIKKKENHLDDELFEI